MRAVHLLRFCQASALPVLLLAHIVARAWIFPRAYGYRADAGPWAEGLWAAQIILLTVWGVLGPWRWYIRWPLAIAAVTYLLWPNANIGTQRWYSLWISVSIVGPLGIVLLAYRWRGRRLLIADGPEPAGIPLRFSIRSICLLTALVAILAKAGMEHRSFVATPRDPTDTWIGENLVSIWFAAGLCGAGMAGVGLLAYWAILSPGRTWWRLLLLAGAVGLVGVSIPWGARRESDIATILYWYGTTSLFVGATLMVLRSAGFRWMKSAAAAESTSSSALRPLATVGVFVTMMSLGALYVSGNQNALTEKGPVARLTCWVEGEPLMKWTTIKIKSIWIPPEKLDVGDVPILYPDPLDNALIADPKP